MSRSPRFATSLASPDLMGGDMAPKALTKQEFGKRLYHMMLAKNWNQSDLARAAGLGRDAISTYVRGRSFPEPVSAKKLADALGVTMDELFPNSIATALDSEIPALEVKVSAGDPTKAWLRINQLVDLDVIPEIISLVNRKRGG